MRGALRLRAQAPLLCAAGNFARCWTSESRRARSNGLYLSPSARRAETDPSLAPLVTARLQHQCALSVCGLQDGRGRATWVMTEQGCCLRRCRRRPRRTPAMPRVHGRRATATNVKRCRTRSYSRRSWLVDSLLSSDRRSGHRFAAGGDNPGVVHISSPSTDRQKHPACRILPLLVNINSIIERCRAEGYSRFAV
jgi:hypothetical protein